MGKNIVKIIVGIVLIILMLIPFSSCTKQEKETYMVCFFGNEGELVEGEEIQYVSDVSEIEYPIYEREGFDFVGWDKNLTSISENVNIVAQWERVGPKYTLNVYSDGVLYETFKFHAGDPIVGLTTPKKDDYEFAGYVEDLPKTMPNHDLDLTVYWALPYVGHLEDLLENVSDYAKSGTVDKLTMFVGGYKIKYRSSEPTLYVIDNENGTGKVSKVKQNHLSHLVTITMTLTAVDGTEEVFTKEITVAPITYPDLPSTPVCTYFSTGAASAYTKYNERYKTDGSYFSEDTKETLNILYYAFASIDLSANVSVNSFSLLDEVSKLKENDVRIVLSVEGVGSSSSKTFYQVTQNEELTKKLAKNFVDTCEKYNFDGIDLDWEFVSTDFPITAKAYTRLVNAVYNEMQARQAKGGTKYLLTAAIPGTSWGASTERFDFSVLNEKLDYINVMSYDLNNPDKTTHLSAMYTSSNDKGYGFGVDYAFKRFESFGMSKSKLIAGCAGYGKAYVISGSVPSATYPGLGLNAKLTKIPGLDGSFDTGTLYGNAVLDLMNREGYVIYTERSKKGIIASYMYNEKEKIFVSYDSIEAVKEKYHYVDAIEGAGIMCWSYTEDTSDNVINAITEEIKNKGE